MPRKRPKRFKRPTLAKYAEQDTRHVSAPTRSFDISVIKGVTVDNSEHLPPKFTRNTNTRGMWTKPYLKEGLGQ
jgi:hypothetical protein